jgi:EmrB/QacA subfamily drug resistance transporter
MTLAYDTRQPCDEAQVMGRGPPFPCPQRDKPWVLATAILGSSLAFIEGSVVNLALPAIQADFGTTAAGIQWVGNAYLLMLVSFMLISGSFGDRYGLRRVFMIGTGVFGLGALAGGLAPSLPLLVGARLVQGLGGAMLVPTSLALIGSHFDESERGRAIGTWAGASALTTAIGPVLGGWLVDHWGWPAVFLLIPPLAVLILLVARWRVPVSPVIHRDRLDHVGAVSLVAALAFLVYGLVNPASQAQRLTLIGLALLFGAAFVWRESRFASPMLPLNLFRSRAFAGANLMTLLLYFALIGVLYFLPFNLIQVQGYSATQAGAAFLPLTLILGFGSTFAGDLIRKFDPRLVLTIGPLIAAVGFTALAIPGTQTSYATSFLPAIAIIGVGMMLSVAPLTTVVMSSVAKRQTGTASGANNTAARLGGVLAVAALTTVAVWRFADALAGQLHEANIPREVAEQMLRHAAELAELAPPADVPASVATSAKEAIALAYASTFRTVVMLCGGLAALSGFIAWSTLAPENSVADETVG